jgi:hypothetical protein
MLITCPDCQKQISDLAPACPNCGCPGAFGGLAPVQLSAPAANVQGSASGVSAKLWVLGLVALLFVTGLGFMVFGAKEDKGENLVTTQLDVAKSLAGAGMEGDGESLVTQLTAEEEDAAKNLTVVDSAVNRLHNC